MSAIMGLTPIQNATKAIWGLKVSHSDYTKMLKGYVPEDMDDRWEVQTDKPDSQGNTVVRICRSWSEQECFALSIAAGNPNQTEVKDWASITEIAWEKEQFGEEVPETKAKASAIAMCKRMLECTLED